VTDPTRREPRRWRPEEDEAEAGARRARCATRSAIIDRHAGPLPPEEEVNTERRQGRVRRLLHDLGADHALEGAGRCTSYGQWLEATHDPVRVLLVFRGAAKSTIYAIYKAWLLYSDPVLRNLIWSEDTKLAKKLTRDVMSILRRHPLCRGMLPQANPGTEEFWVAGAIDARNPSMAAYGVLSNATGSRADNVDFDDIEVPKNIGSAEAREKLRGRISEATHIMVPGGQKTYIGTPHTHDSLYDEQIEGGAAVLKIPLFEHHRRWEDTEDPDGDALPHRLRARARRALRLRRHRQIRAPARRGTRLPPARQRGAARRGAEERARRLRRVRLARALHPEGPRAPAQGHPHAERVGQPVPARVEAHARGAAGSGEAHPLRREAVIELANGGVRMMLGRPRS
jgi:hypothetical protein